MSLLAIASSLSRIGAAVSAACSKIGPAVVEFSQKVAPVIAQVLEAFTPAAEQLGKIAGAFLQGAGILQPGQSVSDLGERALQLGKTTDDYDSFDDYMRALRDFDIDPNKMHTDIERMLAGLAVGTWGLTEKTGAAPDSLNHIWHYPIAYPEYFTDKRLDAFLRAGTLVALSKLAEYTFQGKSLSDAELAELDRKLGVNADGSPMSEAQLGELYSALDGARSKWDDKLRQSRGEGA